MQRTSSGRPFIIIPHDLPAETTLTPGGPVRSRTGISTRSAQVAGSRDNAADWLTFLTWLEATPPTVRALGDRTTASTTPANFAFVPNRSILLTALYGTPSVTSAMLPWLALLRLQVFVNFLKAFCNTDKAGRGILVDRVSRSGEPDDKQVCAFARDLLNAAQHKLLNVDAIPGMQALQGLAAQIAGNAPSHSIAAPVPSSGEFSRGMHPETSSQASSREAETDIAPKRSETRQPASSRNIDRLLAAIRRECMVVMQGTSRMGEQDHPVTHFNVFLEKLLATPARDWPAYFAGMRLSPAKAASNAKYRALCLLRRQTDVSGFGAMDNATPHLALLSACLLGYDLDALWFGTALKGYRPAEVAFWRALSREA